MPICSNCGQENPSIARFCMACTAPLTKVAPAETRKTVTIVFSDLVGSTPLGERLDSEALREVMGRYFGVFRRVLEAHGGVVEKFIGDAVMAVFGLPRAHEDDALRACRAAKEMQRALAELNDELGAAFGVRLANRTGVYTGEVVAGDPVAGQRLVTGDAVNTAARLEQAAPREEVLIGEPTFRLVRNAVSAERVEPVQAKGKADLVPAWRLLDITGEEAIPRRVEAPVVGRDDELAALEEALQLAVSDQRCHVVLLLGEAGVGKSRLVAEFVARSRRVSGVIQGRCLPYGEGITFWPLAEAVIEAAGIESEDAPEDALRKLETMLAGSPDAAAVATRIASAMGLTQEQFLREETFWAARRVFEHIASRRALIVVFDDIQWAEESFLELLRHAQGNAAAPILLLCLARPELLERAPAWATAPLTLTLEPLSREASHHLLANLLSGADVGPDVSSRILAASQGNPLFCEQIVSMWLDDGTVEETGGVWTFSGEPDALRIPLTISSLLASRLDGLLAEERSAIERASVAGQVFYQQAVEELSPSEQRARVAADILSLARKRFVGPDASGLAREKAFQFLHVLIRDAAYSGILKRTRADLHERFANWLERAVGARLSEYEEILGYHLEQANRYLVALGGPRGKAAEMAARAGAVLGSAGLRALARSDVTAATNLLSRAVSLLPENDPSRAELQLRLSIAMSEKGEPQSAKELAELVLRTATENDWQRISMLAKLRVWDVLLATDPSFEFDDVLAETQRLESAFEAMDEDWGVARANLLIALILSHRGEESRSLAPAQKAAEYADRAGAGRDHAVAMRRIASSMFYGSTPAIEGIRWCRGVLSRGGVAKAAEAGVQRAMCGFLAMQGSFEEARASLAVARGLFEDLGMTIWVIAGVPEMDAFVRLLVADWEGAEEVLRAEDSELEKMRETATRSTCVGLLAHVNYAQRRYEEAERLTGITRQLANPADLISQALWQRAQAKLLAVDSRFEEALATARDAVGLLAGSDFLNDHAAACMDLGEVLELAGNRAEARDAFERGARLYEAKGNIVCAGRARALLRSLPAS